MLTLPRDEVFVHLWNPAKNNFDAFCNAFPKTEASPAREENTLLTHHIQLSSQINHVEIVSFQFELKAVEDDAIAN
jgi:hypothetical protein